MYIHSYSNQFPEKDIITGGENIPVILQISWVKYETRRETKKKIQFYIWK